MTHTQDTILDGIEMIVFDLFGTLIEIGDRQRPFAHMWRKLPPGKVGAFRRMAMTSEVTLAEIEAKIGGGATVADLDTAQTAVAHEVASIRLRPGIPGMLDSLTCPYGLLSRCL